MVEVKTNPPIAGPQTGPQPRPNEKVFLTLVEVKCGTCRQKDVGVAIPTDVYELLLKRGDGKTAPILAFCCKWCNDQFKNKLAGNPQRG